MVVCGNEHVCSTYLGHQTDKKEIIFNLLIPNVYCLCHEQQRQRETTCNY